MTLDDVREMGGVGSGVTIADGTGVGEAIGDSMVVVSTGGVVATTEESVSRQFVSIKSGGVLSDLIASKTGILCVIVGIISGEDKTVSSKGVSYDKRKKSSKVKSKEDKEEEEEVEEDG